MKIKDLSPLLASTRKIAIYEEVGEDFPDLYRGFPDTIPPELLAREIVGVGVYDRGILEIQARRV